MGVPKFFRYISERYPCLSEVVKEYQIPEFDNLYLDMNGIIHMCSHPDDNNPHFRITEEKIFADIFHYIEILFRMIKPQKLFFMAVDGVAPRAKMNQQRGRRFRSAKEAEKMEKDAKKKGEVLPEAARFDSNCITPGTEFMARLQEQLKYFVVQKISNDKMWKKCKVILSGHETPGEGEHKIMDYIRYMRAQPNYDPNTRHCLYGLDADLIMLGLCTHEPHFSLLREEVKFGKKSTKRNSVPEDITFFLLHLSLMREYLELEFSPVKEKLKSFNYDFEKIIDDWVLMGFLVGNDFIPHLPNLHISEGALPILYRAYMDVLPDLGGYINEAGTLNLERFEHFFQALSKLDHENFEDYKEDAVYMENKTGRKLVAHTKVSTKAPDKENQGKVDLNLSDFGTRKLHECLEELGLESEDSESEDEFTSYKREYYMNKMEFNKVTPEVMQSQAWGYVRAIQWNLNYYYNGCCSWSWYYPHHYSPYISDIKGFSQMEIDFDRGKPFLPFEQLLAVLPAASKNLLPVSYHDLMTGENSHIKQYYPEEFQTDLNGKKQEWEAVVLVPFIDEDVLLEAMKPCNELLTEEEKNRNKHGPMLVYTYTEDDMGSYKAPQHFPTIASNHAKCEPIDIKSIIVPEDKLIKGAYPGVKLDVYYPGFPTMKHLEYTADVKKAHVKVFEQPSRNESMILKPKLAEIKKARTLMGKHIWVQWPHLIEAKVVSVIGIPDDSGDTLSQLYFDKEGGSHCCLLKDKEYSLYHQRILALKESNMKRWGIDYGDVRVLVQVQEMVGRKYIITAHGRVNLEKQFAIGTSIYPLEGIVTDIKVYNEEGVGFKDVSSVFPVGSPCFVLTRMHYGSMGTVSDNDIEKKDGRVQVTIDISVNQDLHFFRDKLDDQMKSYRTANAHSNSMSISQNVFSRLTGAVIVFEDVNKTTNVGLNLKHNKGNLETPGYTRKVNQTWLYSQKTADLMREYSVKFPEVIAHLTRYPDSDITPKKIFGNDWESKMKELTSWLKNLPIYRAERRVCGSEALDPDFINELAEFVKDKGDKTEVITFSVKPQFLYNPYLQVGNVLPDNSTKSYLFDWIVNVREGYTVPLGLKGVIIAIHRPLNDKEMDINYDVLFVKPFAGGIAVNNSDEQRCYRLPRMAFINISHGQREFRNKIDRAICDTNSKFPGAHNFNHQSQSYISPTRQNNNQSAFASFSGNKRCRIAQIAGPEPKTKGYQGNRNLSNHVPNVQNDSSYPMNLKWGQPVFFQGLVPNSRSVNNYTPKVNNHSGTNSFMPQFSKTRAVQDVSFNKSKFSRSRDPAREDAAGKSEHEESREPIEVRTNQVDSDFLKRLLKINVDSNDKLKNSEPVQVTNDKEIKQTENAVSYEKRRNNSSASSSTKNETPQSNVDRTGVTTQGQVSASVQLLNYYHSIGLGMPRFQYYTVNNRRVAQVVLPDKSIATGIATDSNSDEEASEKAAITALQIIAQKNQNINSTINVNKIQVPPIPVPPQQWVKSSPEENRRNSKDKSLTGNSKTFEKSKHNVKRTKSKSPSFKTATDFVPLQVIRKAQKNSCSENQKSEVEKSPEDTSKKETNVDSPKDKAELKKDKSRKPIQRRKMRLAVNFQN